jgi:hypothetical protein
MEFWLDNKKIAFTTKPNGTVPCSLDTWEEHSLVGSPFKFTASFMTETDARVYLTAKYPHAVEKIAVERLIVPSPKRPLDLRDDDAWRQYREDSHRFRAEISRCLIPKHLKQENPSLSKVHGAGSD